MRGVAYVHTVPQRSIQQLESTVMSISEAPSLDNVDTVMANLEGLCSEETSWKSQETNLEQCLQVIDSILWSHSRAVCVTSGFNKLSASHRPSASFAHSALCLNVLYTMNTRLDT